jgi:hypothetical protein
VNNAVEAAGGGGTNVPPTVSITNPTNGATVSGSSVMISANASDSDGTVTQVAFFVDSTSIGTDTNGSDGWSVLWDSTRVADGAHTLTATATDNAGGEGNQSISVTVQNTAGQTVTVAGLTGSSSLINKNFWKATVVATISPALSGAVVNGVWSNGKAFTCTTDGAGTCSGTLNVSTKTSSITLTVSNVVLVGYNYVPGVTAVTVSRP